MSSMVSGAPLLLMKCLDKLSLLELYAVEGDLAFKLDSVLQNYGALVKLVGDRYRLESASVLPGFSHLVLAALSAVQIEKKCMPLAGFWGFYWQLHAESIRLGAPDAPSVLLALRDTDSLLTKEECGELVKEFRRSARGASVLTQVAAARRLLMDFDSSFGAGASTSEEARQALLVILNASSYLDLNLMVACLVQIRNVCLREYSLVEGLSKELIKFEEKGLADIKKSPVVAGIFSNDFFKPVFGQVDSSRKSASFCSYRLAFESVVVEEEERRLLLDPSIENMTSEHAAVARPSPSPPGGDEGCPYILFTTPRDGQRFDFSRFVGADPVT